jgi:tetratricopeptide (TPR) repeat protein
VTLRTAVRDEIPGAVITVTPRKQWTHARHPYLSGDVSAVRIDTSALGLVPLALCREDEPPHESVGRARGRDGREVYRMEQVYPSASDDAVSDLLVEARECIDAGQHAEADELLHKVLAVDLRCLDAHALLGERNLAHWPALALHHFELGVAIGSLTAGEDFDGVLPWSVVDNRPFLRCLHGYARALMRLDRREAAAAALQRLVRLDPADRLAARTSLAALEAGKSWREMEKGP